MRADQALNVALAALTMIANGQEQGGAIEAAMSTREAAVDLAKLLHVMPAARMQRTSPGATEYECSACKNIFPWELEGNPSDAVKYCPCCGAPIAWGKEPTELRPISLGMRLDINVFIKIKLTPVGIRILQQQHEQLRILHKGRDIGPFKLPLDNNGYYTTQLWELMRDFGPHLRQGLTFPFDPEIIIDNAYLY